MRRALGVAALAAGLAMTVGACGVQTTGVHVASASPFSVTKMPDPAPRTSSGGGQYPVDLILVNKTNLNVRQVTRMVSEEPRTVLDLFQQLWDTNVTADESENGLTSNVSPDFTLRKSPKSAHEYIIDGTVPSNSALYQMTCTFDAWWRAHPDSQGPSAQFLLPDGTVARSWDDCTSLLGAVPGKPARPSALPTPPSHGN